jgi:hypothetical protein
VVKYSMTPDQLSAAFAALADPTRRAILARLASGDASVTELGAGALCFDEHSGSSLQRRKK